MSAIPETYQAFRRTTGPLPRTIERTTEKVPKNLSPTDVLIHIHAVSLNFRDIAMLDGRYPIEVLEHGISASDCAASVAVVGSSVKAFAPGDHVSPIFDLNALTGEEYDNPKALGGDAPGVLAQYAVFDEKYLVHLPKDMAWTEASTLTVAGVTAWNSLGLPANADKNKTALLEGTGGVSMFALALCLAANIHPIITSSSSAKLSSIRALFPAGAVSTINHQTHPDWAAEAKRLTNNKGVDIVINNVGASSIDTNVNALRNNGLISLVGFLGGFTKGPSADAMLGIMARTARLQGIMVGSKVDYEALCDFLEEKKVKLDFLVDKVFAFEDSKAAFEHLDSGTHTGKVVIRV
ncbi:NAD(P)-binding protein [Saccharata proteae CBS 121410]|uniref:NAD(P)-binding protein n=1 Tax=Saccharata proteae CBS 121410 TaxID=1314787 RepID=A0A9P4LW00_9PEZI|nr:NAD(P)-binding protein [Saccharata proteae CBS 121410]